MVVGIFRLMVGSDGYFLVGGGWQLIFFGCWWVGVGGGGSWHRL